MQRPVRLSTNYTRLYDVPLSILHEQTPAWHSRRAYQGGIDFQTAA